MIDRPPLTDFRLMAPQQLDTLRRSLEYSPDPMIARLLDHIDVLTETLSAHRIDPYFADKKPP